MQEKKTSTDKNQTMNKSYTNKSTGKKSTTKSFAKKSTTNKSFAKKSATNKSTTNKSYAKKSTTNKSYADKSATNKPVTKYPITKKENPNKPEINIDLDLFYMTPTIIMAKEIYVFLQQEASITVDLWEDMNILQVELANKKTIDFEFIKPEFKDPSDQSFIQNRGVKAIYAITMEQEDFQEMKKIFAKVIQKFGGFICTDSEDFKPQYTVEDLLVEDPTVEVKSDEYGVE